MFIQTLEDKALTVLQLGAYRRISLPERVSVSLKPMSQSYADVAGRPYTPQAEAMPSGHPHRLTTRVTFWGCMWRGLSLHRQRIQPRARTRRSPIVVKGWIGPNQGSLEDLEPRLCVTDCEREPSRQQYLSFGMRTRVNLLVDIPRSIDPRGSVLKHSKPRVPVIGVRPIELQRRIGSFKTRSW
jgi:hypothetical protein